MLLFVQAIQISRALTTYENMRGAHMHSGRATASLASALTTGSSSLDGAQLNSAGRGPDPAVASNAPGAHSHHHDKTGCFAQWKKILGVDTFVETALHGYEGNRSHRPRPRNAFSRGVVGNCKDFWCDTAPVFGKRENGIAMLGGEVVDYTRMYETPPRMRVPGPHGGDGAGAYESLDADEAV